MDTFTFVLILILGILLGLIVSIIPFIDFTGIIFNIFPTNVPSDFKKHKELISSNRFRNHKRKWKRLFCLVSVIYTVVYCIISLLFNSISMGFYGALIASVIYFGITSNIEHNQRELLISEKTADKG